MSNRIREALLLLRTALSEGPSWCFHFLFSRIYSTSVLRMKAAATPYPSVRRLLLVRSGIEVGDGVFLHMGVLVVGISRNPPALSLGDRAAIGPYVTFVTASDPNPSVLLHHPELRNAIVDVGPITVEPDVWIGAGAIILPNVRIGRGSVIGSGAVVTKDVPPFTVVTGVPAKAIRRLTPPDALATRQMPGDLQAVRETARAL